MTSGFLTFFAPYSQKISMDPQIPIKEVCEWIVCFVFVILDPGPSPWTSYKLWFNYLPIRTQMTTSKSRSRGECNEHFCKPESLPRQETFLQSRKGRRKSLYRMSSSSSWCQFHQHYTRAFFIRMSFQQIFLVTCT